MDIRISGHQIDTGEALQAHANDRLTAMVEKYFNRALSAHVTFGKAPAASFRCDIVMHVMQGLLLKGSAIAHDAHQAFEQSAEKIDKQLRRYKRRLKDRHEQAVHALKEEEAAYVIFEEPPFVETDDESETPDAPVVIAETRVDVPETTVSDAVMMLDLRNTTALFFKNAGTGRHNMVYRRDDGSIGWVEPS
ncbi:ribosomal subunit interface protein [Novosphingobium marinum]|uniref:Ribosome hibernation promoting factor n=1 Tax=Novosphingobium marinum TaxID=1514948 RepID=A0A7Y9XW04_9SPHN|nr:ribosome-associated translation inhibitor RaiA [Novosphingobium marinum]NYH95636.1 ribosomal subunit interface protein [Novosphingobium marinum]GGC28612.1 ribosomal subunit interface protein [Novosphingobium marinum]